MTSKHRITVGEELRYDADVQGLRGLSGTYERKQTPDSVSPAAQGVVANYTGRLGTTGTGTDSRAAIQAALNNASSVAGASYYSYLNRKSTVVELPPGDYYLSAPTGGTAASLVIPPGVVFDFTKATLHCNYPDTATDNWCAIQVGQYGSVKVGKLYTRTGSSPPDSRDMYDGIRVVNTDNMSRVTGYHDSEINSFQGAGVRFVGAWISYAQGLRINGCSYGVVASRSGSAFNYTVPVGGATLPRTNTDVFVSDCIIVNCAKGGILGLVKGDTGVQNDMAFGTGQLANILSIIGTTIEQCGEFAAHWGAAQSFAWSHSRIEDCGSSGSSAVWLDAVRTATVEGMVLSLQGDTHPTASGTGTSFIANLFRLSTVGTFSLKGLFTTNTYKTGLVFANGTPSGGWFVTGVKNDANDFASGGIYPGAGNTGTGGTWNAGHLVVGSLHAWQDIYDRFRVSRDAPADDLDGMTFAGTGDKLIVGEETLDRMAEINTRAIPTANGDLRLTFFQARKTETISQIRVPTGSVAQAGATLIKLGIYEENRSTGDLILVGQTANTLTLFLSTVTATEYTTALTASFTKTRGKRYAYGPLVVGATTTPTYIGYSPSNSTILARAPRRTGLVSSQTDLPASITAASLSAWQGACYAELLP